MVFGNLKISFNKTIVHSHICHCVDFIFISLKYAHKSRKYLFSPKVLDLTFRFTMYFKLISYCIHVVDQFIFVMCSPFKTENLIML